MSLKRTGGIAVVVVTLTFLIGRPTWLAAQVAATAGTCDAVLIQDVDLTKLSRIEQLSWLKLINKSNYDKALLNTGASAVFDGVPFSGHEEATHDTGEQVMTKENYNFTLDEARAIYRRHLSADKVAAWEKCVTRDAIGVTISFNNESQKSATARLYYNGISGPGHGVTFELQLEGGRIDGKRRITYTLYSGGAHSFQVLRDGPTSVITAIVNGVQAQITDSATSFPRLPQLRAGHKAAPCLLNQLLSGHRPVMASIIQEEAYKVTDGQKSPGNWNSLAKPPQWVVIDLGGPRTINFIRLNPEQLPGHSTHIVSGWNASSNQWIEIGTLDGETVSGGEFDVHSAPEGGLRGISKVKVLTTVSGGDGSVSWREIEVYGCPN